MLKEQQANKVLPPRADSAERSGVQSIVRAFAILESIAHSSDGLGLAELSRKVGLHNSTTFNLVKTMLRLGYIRQSAEDKHYRLGRPLFCLAAHALDEVGLVSLATDVLRDLSLQTGETGHFAVWSGDQAIVLAKSNGAGAFQLSDHVGGARPAYATALGKVLLSGIGPRHLAQYFAKVKLIPYTPRTITDAKRLQKEIKMIAQTRVAFDDAEYFEEVRCMAVPVLNFAGQIVGALGLSGPIWRLSIQILQEKVDQLKSAAAHLSTQLGHGGFLNDYSPAMKKISKSAAKK